MRAGAASKLGVDRGAARRGKGVLDSTPGVETFVMGAIGHQPHLSAHHLRTLVADAFPALELPPLRTFQHVIGGWKKSNDVALTKLTNPDKFKSHFRASARGSSHPVSRLNELWMIDASPADVMLKEGRFAIYLCVDIFSRRVSIYVTKTPRAEAVGLLLRKAMLAWGMPERIKTDNGSDFRAKFTQRLMAALAIEVEVAAPFSPEQKGHVERAIGTMQRDLMPLLPGFIGHNVAHRKVIEERKAFSQRLGENLENVLRVDMDAAALQRAADEWAALRYAHRPHAGLAGRTPFEAAASFPGAIRQPPGERALDMLLAPVPGGDGMRKITKSGVRIGGEHFMTPTVLPGADVLVRMDPQDAGRAHLFSPSGDEYLGEAICPALAGVDPAALIARVRAAQKAMLDEGTADIRKAMRAIKPRDHIEAVLRQAAKDSGTLVDFPRRMEAHTTPQIDAAGSVRDDAPAPAAKVSALVSRMQAEVEADLAGNQASAPAANVTPLRQSATREQRFRRALDLRAALARGEPLPSAETLWLGGYEGSSEWQAMLQVYEDFGDSALG